MNKKRMDCFGYSGIRFRGVEWALVLAAAVLFACTAAFPANAADDAVLPADETIWVPVFEDSIAEPESFTLPLGDTQEGGFTISRSLADGAYRWTIQSADGRYSLVTLPNLTIPADYQLKIEMDVQMPAFEPYACSGVVFAEKAGSFYNFMACSDRTYALFRNEAGDWRELIPFTPFTSVDPGDMIPVQIQVRGAWADFLIAGDFVDAFRVGNSDGNIGLFAQPIGTDPATIDFRRLSVSVSPQPVAAEAAPGGGVPDDLSRSLRMLYLKGRIPSVEGRFYPIEGKTLTLANMGYFDQAMFDHHAFDAMVQAKIKFKSAYDHPDFPHAGCGFTIRRIDASNYVQAFIALDGLIYLQGVRNGSFAPIIQYSYGTWSLEGEALLTLIAVDNKLTVMYNGRLMGTVTDASWFMKGDAGLTVFSGTNFDYGQFCEFSDIQYFVFDAEDSGASGS